MSNHSCREPKPHRKYSGWALIGVSLLILFVLSLNFIQRSPAHANWHTSEARVLGTRITVQGSRGASHTRPSEIYYRGEAHVTYTANGKQYDQWLPATNTIDDRDWLAVYLSKHSATTAEVKWNPANPSQGRVTLRAP